MRMSMSTMSGSTAFADEVEAFVAVARFADHDQVGLGFEDHPQTAAHHRLVVDDDDPDRPPSVPGLGLEVRTGHREAGLDGPALVGSRSRASWPPKTATRSAMPASPRRLPAASAGVGASSATEMSRCSSVATTGTVTSACGRASGRW